MNSPVFNGGTRKEGGPRQASEVVSVRLLGDFRVSVGRRVIEENDWRLRKAAAIVKLLALAPEHRLHRERIVDLLWPALDPRAGSNNLRRTLHAARRVLDPAGERGAADYLVSRGGHVALCPAGNLRVDVDAFEELAGYARGSREPAAYEAALDLYAGDLLPGDPYEGWAEGRRRELRETCLSLLSGLASAHEERGEYDLAIDALRELTREEPADEGTHANMMRLHALSGHEAEALRQYGLLREALGRIGAEPGCTTRRLRDEIASGRLAPNRAPNSLPEETQEPKHNLPAAGTSFVGRGREMAEVKRTLATTRLLTLTGTGGCGKTRLALEVGRGLDGVYPDGARLVELAHLSEEALLPRAVAGAVGVREQPGRPLPEDLLGALRDKGMVLIMDNCEHLTDAAARLAETLLDSCPRLRILATSREPLGATGEVTWRVPSLCAPSGLRPPMVGELETYESARLFVDRARGRHPGFELRPENAAAVAEICARLAGIPLAVELAAARVGMLSVRQISDRLGHSLKVLTGGDRSADHRHRTLRATLDWSYELLDEPEQVLLGRISVFSGGFTLEAAESVGAGGGVEEEDVLDVLLRLEKKSLLIAQASWEKGARYRMLEPVGQYARERLEASGEAEAVRRRHAAYFLALAEGAEPELKGPGQVEWLSRLEEDNGNLRAAMTFLLEKDEIEDAVRMAWALWIFWLIHGHQSEGRRWIEEALARGENLGARARARALAVQFSTYYGHGSPERMGTMAEEAAALFREAGDDYGLAYVLGCLAAVKMQQGDTERAIALYEEALELSRDLGEKWGPSGALGHLGSIYLGLGDHERAARSFEEGLSLSREIENRLGEATALYGLAMAEQGRGDHERAAELYAEGLASAAEAGDKANIAYSLEGLAQLAAARGEAEHAARLLGAAEASLESAGGTLYPYAQDRSLYERAVGEVRSRLSEAAFSAAWFEGRAMGPAEAVEYALSGKRSVASGKTALPGGDIVPGRPVGLTRREEEVAALVTRGLTNRRIAAELSISEHTVANHVANLLRKLKLSSRAQLSALMASRGVPD